MKESRCHIYDTNRIMAVSRAKFLLEQGYKAKTPPDMDVGSLL